MEVIFSNINCQDYKILKFLTIYFSNFVFKEYLLIFSFRNSLSYNFFRGTNRILSIVFLCYFDVNLILFKVALLCKVRDREVFVVLLQKSEAFTRYALLYCRKVCTVMKISKNRTNRLKLEFRKMEGIIFIPFSFILLNKVYGISKNYIAIISNVIHFLLRLP